MTGRPPPPAGRDPVDSWILRHTPLAVLAVLLSGLAIRLVALGRTYLSSDEVVHFQLVNVSSLGEVYRATLTNAHPPLFFMLLHFWNRIDSSEFFLRLLPAFFGMALIWVVYRWTDQILGKSVAFYALNLVAFSPGLVSLSSEVRGYTLVLSLIAGALLVLELAFQRRSPVLMGVFSGLLSLAMLTHYSAFWIAIATFIYVLFRVLTERPSWSLTAAWLVSQTVPAALGLFLYWTHLSKLRGSGIERAVMNRAEYFYPSQEGALDYLGRQTFAFFRFLLGPRPLAFAGLLAAVVAIGLLARRNRSTALLMGLPFLLAASGGLAAIYFYGGTRHSAYLTLFAAAAIGVVAASITGGRIWPAFVLGALLMWACWVPPDPRGVRDVARMRSAIETVRTTLPAGGRVFADFHSGLTLYCYLGGDDFFRANPTRNAFWESRAGGYRLTGSYEWAFTPVRFASELERWTREGKLPAGSSVWLFHTGPEIDPGRLLETRFPGTVVRTFRFGEIVLVEARVP